MKVTITYLLTVYRGDESIDEFSVDDDNLTDRVNYMVLKHGKKITFKIRVI